jgi:hypothetical protein
MSTVNNLYKDHGREPVALGDLVERVRKELAASRVTLAPTLIRVPLRSAVVRRALTREGKMRSEFLLLGIDDVPRPKLEQLRVCIATIFFCLFLRGGACVECLIGDLVIT